MGALQKRQAEIIKQLEQLRLKLNEMQFKLGVTEKPVQEVKKVQKKVAPVIKPIDVSSSMVYSIYGVFQSFGLYISGKIPSTIGDPCESSQYSVFIVGFTNIVDESIEFSY